MVEKMETVYARCIPGHAHHWEIEGQGRMKGQSMGKCRNCGHTRVFENYVDHFDRADWGRGAGMVGFDTVDDR